MSARGKDIVQAGNTVLVSVPAQIVGNAYFRERGRIHWGALQRGFDALAAAGYAVVPVEPTEARLQAGRDAYRRKQQDAASPTPTEHPGDGGGPMGYAYRAMLAAAGETKE
jgi:hypothetical protein